MSSHRSETLHIGVDVGGTFTDVVCLRDAGGFFAAKVPSTPGRAHVGVVNATAEIVRAAGAKAEDIRHFIHGTTVATNAIIEHKGARVGILMTDGFEDTLEIGRYKRAKNYDVWFDVETPVFLAPRRRRKGIVERLDFEGNVLILAADVPLLRPGTLQKLVAARQGADVALISFRTGDPTGYGRIVRRSDGSVARVVEERDASAEERKIAEVNASIYLADARFLFTALRSVGRSNAQGEYYLTDIVARGRAVAVEAEETEVSGINDRAQLARSAAQLHSEARKCPAFVDRRRSWTFFCALTDRTPGPLEMRPQLCRLPANCVNHARMRVPTFPSPYRTPPQS